MKIKKMLPCIFIIESFSYIYLYLILSWSCTLCIYKFQYQRMDRLILVVNLQRTFYTFLIQQNSNEYLMILKNNRFFGRDISNVPQNVIRNHSQQFCEKRTQKHSHSFVQPSKHSMDNIMTKMPIRESEKADSIALPQSIEESNNCVPEYFTDIFRFMRTQQTSVIGNYCEKTINIDKNSRGEVINWLVDVHYKFRLFPQTLYFVVYFMDKYLAQKNVQKNKLKLIAISCLYMSAKYQETYRVPQLKDLLSLCNYAYTKRDILETEADIIRVLNFDLVFDPSYKFLEALEVFSGMNKKNFHLAQYLIELSLTQSEFLEYSQSLIACSAFYLVCKIRKLDIDWDEKYQNLTDFKQNDLHKCARELCNFLQKIDKMNNISALRKKFSQGEFHEVTRLKLERKK